MNEEELKDAILQILEQQDDEITADQIYEELGRSVDPGRTQEQIRGIIRVLANDEKHLIGSSKRGFFKIKTKADAEKAIGYLTSRIPDLNIRAQQIATKWNEENPENPIEV